MTPTELKLFIDNNKSNFSIQLKRNHPKLYALIDKLYSHDIKFSEKTFIYLNGESIIGKCKLCGNKTQFDGFLLGYRTYCSCKCRSKDVSILTNETRQCIVCGKNFLTKKTKTKKICSNECRTKHNAFDDVNKKRFDTLRKSMVKKYGVECASQYDLFKEKSKQTKLERYGDENYNNINKSKQTKLDKHGNENYVNHEKSKQTKLERYGDENYNNTNKIKTTMLQNHGVEWAMYSSKIKEKAKQTLINNYGGIGLAADKIKEKIKATMINTYGVDNPLKNDEIKKQVKTTNYNKYGGFTLSSPVLKEKYDKTLKEKYGVDNVSQIKYVKDKVKEFYKKEMIHDIFHGDRLQNKVMPIFDPAIYINSEYNNRYKFKCNTCYAEFLDHLYSGHIPRCPSCYPPSITKPQQEIIDYIKSIIKEDMMINTRSILNKNELDIYIPLLKIAIEYNGLYWHGEISGKKDKKYHLNKTIECEKLGIHLIHIFEDEWFDKQSIVKRKLNHLFGCNKNDTIYARKCDIKVIDGSVCDKFLTEYHLQGKDKSSIKLGAFYNGELVSVMTFGSNRVALGSNKKNNHYEMYRFCIGCKNIIGIGGKLFSYFIKHYNPEKITTYADKRYSFNNAFYTKIGFNKVKDTPPNYWYFDKSGIRLHRFNFRKSELIKKLKIYDPNLTEWQNMQLNGYDRIWDCGHYKYEWVRN